MRLVHILVVFTSGLLLATSCAGGSALDVGRQQAMIRKVIDLTRANYVFPERAETVATMLETNLRSGTYSSLNTTDSFLETLNCDLQSAAGDKHLMVIHSPRIAAQLKGDIGGEDQVSPEYLSMLREQNFRLRKVEFLDGNVGYFKFDNFVERRFVDTPFTGAMNFLGSSAALILDLRDNGGGASETANLLISYFLPEGTRTGESWNRVTDVTTQNVVQTPDIVHPMLATPLYVLVSGHTASAAEAVAYTLQQAKRAIVIGSRTKGMANAGRHFLLDDENVILIPTTRKKDASSGTNWEGTGVTPDRLVESGMALDAAMAEALKYLAERRADKTSRQELSFAAEAYQARLHPQAPPAGFFEACQGQYDQGTKIESQDGALWLVQGESRRRLQFMRDDTFVVEGRLDYRLRFPFSSGSVTTCEILWYDDTSESRKRLE